MIFRSLRATVGALLDHIPSFLPIGYISDARFTANDSSKSNARFAVGARFTDILRNSPPRPSTTHINQTAR